MVVQRGSGNSRLAQIVKSAWSVNRGAHDRFAAAPHNSEEILAIAECTSKCRWQFRQTIAVNRINSYGGVSGYTIIAATEKRIQDDVVVNCAIKCDTQVGKR
jgi:hypothetical protein